MTTPSDDAQKIYQGLIDQLDAYIEASNFDAFAAKILLPYSVQSHEEVFLVEDLAQLRAGFDDMRNRMAMRNIARRSRHCTHASFADIETIVGNHTTWLVDQDNNIVESYKVSNTLRCVDGSWCVAGNGYSGAPDTLPLHMLDAMTRLAGQRK